jgi:hypothetical protein
MIMNYSARPDNILDSKGYATTSYDKSINTEALSCITYDWETHKGHLEVFDEYGIRYLFY